MRHSRKRGLSPIDEVIASCIDIHRELKKSSSMLKRFSHELRLIAVGVQLRHRDRQPEETTILYSGASERSGVDHRLLLDGYLEESYSSEDEALHSPKVAPSRGLSAITAQLNPNIDTASNGVPKEHNAVNPRARAEFVDHRYKGTI